MSETIIFGAIFWIALNVVFVVLRLRIHNADPNRVHMLDAAANY